MDFVIPNGRSLPVRNLLFAEAMSDFLSRKNPSEVAALKITAAHVRAPVNNENKIRNLQLKSSVHV
jgi:hypothetical protein